MAAAPSVGDGRRGATPRKAREASPGPSPQRAPWQADRQLGLIIRPPLTLLALFEAIAVAVHFEDVDVVCQPVEQRAGQPLRPEHAGPFVKRQIGSDDGGAALVTLTEDLEQELATSCRQWHIAQFVDDQQLVGLPLPL